MTSRAIFLEVVCSKSTQSVAQALIRFCARRGVPTEMFSDNEKASERRMSAIGMCGELYGKSALASEASDNQMEF